ncbi:MAG: adenosylcobinamide-GDP ribazoletransferase [Bacteroidota bacterium]
MLRQEIRVFFTALMFYSRIPCPKWVDHSSEMLNKATRYFPLIGWIVAGISGGVLYAFIQILPTSVAIILSMIASILVTGAFHEDGFADVCDGFGGGWTKKRILEIMKDSVIGAYGVVGMVLILLLKYLVLRELSFLLSLLDLCAILFSAHAVSRFMAVLLIKFSAYARENEDAKAKPVAKRLPTSSFLVAFVFGLAPLIYFQSIYILLAILPLLLITAYLGRYFRKWIGGYTGDCLGATQQVTEVVFYLSCLGIWKFI